MSSIVLEYEKNNFNGTFSYFYKLFTNYSVSKLINVNASSSYEGRGNCFNVINPLISKTSPSYNWLSQNLENSSLTFTFLKHSLAISSYSIKARQDTNDFNHPYEFVLEASNDNFIWTEIHHKTNDDTLIGKGKEGHWNCKTNEFFSIFKLTMLYTNYHIYDYEKYIFALSTVEFFGTLRRKEECFNKLSCNKNVLFFFPIDLFVNIII